MSVRVVVADQSTARFYDANRFDRPLRLFDNISDAKGRLHDRDFDSDRPGRVFDRALAVKGRRGAVSRHSTGGERSSHRHEAEVFARRIVAVLQAGHKAGQFDALVLIAEPRFLGTLHSVLPKSLKNAVKCEIRKDLVHSDAKTLREYLPSSAFDAAALT